MVAGSTLNLADDTMLPVFILLGIFFLLAGIDLWTNDSPLSHKPILSRCLIYIGCYLGSLVLSFVMYSILAAILNFGDDYWYLLGLYIVSVYLLHPKRLFAKKQTPEQ